MNLLDAVILGIVEGLTEYLPVSSTGHLILTAALLGLNQTPEQKQAVDTFNIVIQGGAILAVLGLYWPRILQMIRGLLGIDPAGRRLFINIIVAFLPAAVFGFLLADQISKRLFSPGPVIGALAVGGLLMIFIGKWQRRFFHESIDADHPDAHSFVDIEHLTWRRALIIGLLQCIAMWPGTSRSLMTIVGGMLVGMKPRHAAEFSFLLALPTLGGACAYSAVKSFKGDGPNLFESIGWAPIVVGLLVATVSAAIAVKFLVGFLNKHGLSLFGWYRLVLSAVMIVLVLRGVIKF